MQVSEAVTTYELISANESLLRTMRRNGIGTRAVDYLDAYRELRAIEGKGHKTGYAVAKVAQHHGISERQVYALKATLAHRVEVD